jgi:hypothetical protein
MALGECSKGCSLGYAVRRVVAQEETSWSSPQAAE